MNNAPIESASSASLIQFKPSRTCHRPRRGRKIDSLSLRWQTPMLPITDNTTRRTGLGTGPAALQPVDDVRSRRRSAATQAGLGHQPAEGRLVSVLRIPDLVLCRQDARGDLDRGLALSRPARQLWPQLADQGSAVSRCQMAGPRDDRQHRCSARSVWPATGWPAG